MAQKLIDMTGQRFGRLVVLCRAALDHARYAAWDVQCDCGRRKVVRATNLRNGKTSSCGCLKTEVLRGLYVVHGHDRPGARSRTLRSYREMHSRCENPNASGYENYGGRGVTVCDRWAGPQGFLNFLADMGECLADPPGWTGARCYTLDRIDPYGNYEPDNCRWADRHTQATNKRRRVT